MHATHSFFFFNDPAPTDIYPLPLPDALPICQLLAVLSSAAVSEQRSELLAASKRLELARTTYAREKQLWEEKVDRKSTRLNSSHGYISYAVFCLKKKKHEYYARYPSHSVTF